MSAQVCGCDPEADWTCQRHLAEQPQVCRHCERVRMENSERCWCGANWAEMLSQPKECHES